MHTIPISCLEAVVPLDYNERQAHQAEFKRQSGVISDLCVIYHVSRCILCHAKDRLNLYVTYRKLDDPDANSIPKEFVNLWLAACNTRAKALVLALLVASAECARSLTHAEFL